MTGRPTEAALRIDVVTIFPAYLDPLRLSLLGRAIERGALDLRVHDLRAWTDDPHHSVDDTPYGGGPGMVMRAEPWGRALDELAGPAPDGIETELTPTLIVPTPTGERFSQALAAHLTTAGRLIFACGRYEGIDARVLDYAAEHMAVREVSLGDYVLFGGEAAVLVMVEAIVRLLDGVLGNEQSAIQESFSDGLLEGPTYTKPPVWRGREVPPVLRSGDHGAIARWRHEQALLSTADRRPDLLPAADVERHY